MIRTLTGTVRVPPEPLDGPVLQHPQQLDLHRQRHVVDVVEEDRAAVGELEAAGPILDRAGERAALVAEQLRLDQRFRKQRAADGDEWMVLAAARLVDQRRGDFLAGAALAGDAARCSRCCWITRRNSNTARIRRARADDDRVRWRA